MKLSLAMITKNEEAVLARCLDSVKDYVDEIIIVDTGSTDKTKEIARQYTDKIYDFEWIDNFAAARNYSFSKCTCEWIIWIDCDDVLKPADAKRLKKFDFSNKEIVLCDYHYFHDEYDNTVLIVPRERIIKRSLGLQWVGEIHEGLPLGNRNIFRSDIAIHHYKQGENSARNLRILERIARKNKGDSRNIYYLAKEYQESGSIEKAIQYFKMYVKKPDGWWEDRYQAYYRIAECYLMKRNITAFMMNIFKSIELEPRRAEPYFKLGQFYMNRKEWEKAIHWFETGYNLKRPSNLWSSYRPDHYTWLPCLNLCLCYNAIGNVEKAYEYNKIVLQFRPDDSRALNNDKILSPVVTSDKYKRDGEGKKLNLGCGDKIEDGYTNVDLFKGDGIDEVFELDNIPYTDNSISTINSEHALEHLTFDKVSKAVSEWYRVLKPGGELLLKIPDLELCSQAYLLHPILHSNVYKTKHWFKNTIFGIQRSLKGEPDEAQIHRSGFNKDEIRMVLERTGFVIDYLENYDGWGTPSLGLRALKPVKNFKVGWISSVNWEAAQTRIRVLNVDRFLRSRGYQSKVVNYPEIISQNYDVAIVGKGFDEHHFKNIKMLKENGKTVFCDLCEDILEYPWVNEILKICDKVICCSYKLEEMVKKVNSNTIVIEDAYES